jgi:Tfp pilus assembly protein PilN
MIEINLLPEELKFKIKGRSLDQAITRGPLALIQDQVFIYLIPVILVIFILLHFYFGILLVSKNMRLAALNRKWSALAVQKKAVDAFNQEFSTGPQDTTLLLPLARQRVLWAQKLNLLSLNLPAEIWFREILINSNNLTIKGSVISLEKKEINLINKFLDSLKTSLEFSKDFSNFDLSNVQNRDVGGYDIADFVLMGALKSR